MDAIAISLGILLVIFFILLVSGVIVAITKVLLEVIIFYAPTFLLILFGILFSSINTAIGVLLILVGVGINYFSPWRNKREKIYTKVINKLPMKM